MVMSKPKKRAFFYDSISVCRTILSFFFAANVANIAVLQNCGMIFRACAVVKSRPANGCFAGRRKTGIIYSIFFKNKPV